MRKPLIFLGLGGTLLVAAAFVPGCSNGTLPPDEGGTDSGGGDSPSTTDGPKPEGGNDAGKDPCTDIAITGDCDLVAQDCASTEECIPQIPPDGGAKTICQKAGSGSITEGAVCTAGKSNPCVKGLECINSRCSKHCCNKDDSYCGVSKPEGYTGRCDLNIVDNDGKALYSVCAYDATCIPFGIQACPGKDQTCIVKDVSGTATCSPIYQPPGLNEGQTCASANACKDGMYCLNSPGKCTYVCYKKGVSTPPFKETDLDLATPGRGGCPSGQTCKSGITGLPDWIGACAP